jgi:DNA polymerase-4
VKSISHETTFEHDIADLGTLRWHLWSLAEQVSARAKASNLVGRVVTLKLKRADFALITRRQTVAEATQMADRIYRTAFPMLRRDMGEAPFRLIGVGLAALLPADGAAATDDLLDPPGRKRLAAERALDRIRARFGQGSIMLGRTVR